MEEKIEIESDKEREREERKRENGDEWRERGGKYGGEAEEKMKF